MNHPDDQSAHERSVDADILQIAANGVFQPASDGLCVPAPHCLAYQPDYPIAVAVCRADSRAAGKTIDHEAYSLFALQRAAKLPQRLSKTSGGSGRRIARRAKQTGAALFPETIDPALHGRIGDQFISDLGNASLHRDI